MARCNPSGAALAFLTGVCLLSRCAVAAGAEDFVIRQDVHLVLLDVGVRDRAGNLVHGLSRENFTILEDGKPQDIAVFDNSDVPVTMGLLVDESQSMNTKRAEVLAAAQSLIEQSNRHDDVFVLNFNTEVRRGLPEAVLFSNNIPQLRAALFRGVPQGKTALYDAVMAGLRQLEASRQGRKALVVISDGGDNASLHKRPEMLSLLERSGATVFAVGLFTPGEPDADPAILRRLAHLSGGEALFPREPSGMDAACDRIAKEIRARYVIGYRPPQGPSGALRHIRVRVNAPQRGLTVISRDSYRFGGGIAAENTGSTYANPSGRKNQ